MHISLHPFSQIINQVACQLIRGLLTQIVAYPGWAIFDQLNIWTFQNLYGSLHVIRFSSFPYVKCTVSLLLQKISCNLGTVGIEKEPGYSPCQNIEVKVSKRSRIAKN